MTPLQTTRALARLLRSAVWPEGAGEPVLGEYGVVVAPGVEAENLPGTVPVAVLNVGQGTADRAMPGLIQQRWTLVVATRVEGDATNEGAVVGGVRAAGEGASAGRGVLELEPQILSSVGRLTGADGTPFAVRLGTAAGVVDLGGAAPFVERQYEIEGWCTIEEEWPAPQRLVAEEDAGTVSLTWFAPEPIGGLVGYEVRRASGSTAPALPTAGTQVALASPLDLSVEDEPGSGTWSYAVFARWDDRGGSVGNRWSAQDAGTTRTVEV